MSRQRAVAPREVCLECGAEHGRLSECVLLGLASSIAERVAASQGLNNVKRVEKMPRKACNLSRGKASRLLSAAESELLALKRSAKRRTHFEPDTSLDA